MHVTVVCATSLDGKLATASRGPVRFTSRRDRARLHALRDAADAVLVGGATVRAEDPPLLPAKPPYPVRAIFSRTLDLPRGRALVVKESAPAYVFTADTGDAGKRAALEAAGVLVRSASVRDALETLRRERGCERFVALGGGQLNADLFAADLVDELELTLCPVILGGTEAPTLVDGPGFTDATLKRAKLVAHEATPEGELFLRYSLR